MVQWRAAAGVVALVVAGSGGVSAAAQAESMRSAASGSAQSPGGGDGRVALAERAFPAAADTTARELYELACASCHGADGMGVDPSRVAFDVPVPDFTDCSFASREPDADWIAVAHAGGPVRGFATTMPAFGEALTEEQLQQIMDHIRTFCSDTRWPRGELNLPRALFTEKAYPEDEAVATVVANLEGPGGAMTELLYEKRFGPRTQIEIEVPFGVRERAGPDGDWSAGIGDIGVAVKQALWHSLDAGGILSAGAEAKLPTGDRDRGFGNGTVLLEPYLAYGQILPSESFVQLFGGVEVPLDSDRGETEAIWRGVVGRTWTAGQFGRSWTPMLEVLGATELGDGSGTSVDVVPQMQVTMNTRQHVILNLGVRVPVTDADVRSSQFVLYVLWDWFDGGFFDGW